MTHIEELQRKAVLHRQSAIILRADVKRHDEAARMIDGGVSEAEALELTMLLRLLTASIEKASLEYRLALLGAS